MKGKLFKLMKRTLCYGLTLSMVVGSLLPAKVAEAASDATLIAKYDFENVSGTTVPNVAEGAAGFAGALNGSGAQIVDSELGKSVKFTGSQRSWMQVDSIVNTGTKSYSISMWYKYDTTVSRGNKRVVLLQQNGGGRTLLTLTSGNQYHTYVNTSDVTGNTTIDPAEWQHVTFVTNAETKEVTWYVNGELDSTKASGNGSVNELTALFIGSHKNSTDDPMYMRGLVDEVKVYEGIVTAEEAKAIYNEKSALVRGDGDEEEPEANEVVLTVDPTTVERTIDGSVFGINHRYAFNGYGTFDPYLMEMKDDFQALYEEAGFGSIRYPGGTISNLFNWKTTLDSVGRKNQIHGFYNNSGQGGIEPNFGIKEIADFADEVNSEIVYVYSLGRGSVQDAQDLIEFLNAEVGTNPNGGIDWAEVRAENGHPKPYNVRYFEIGNEMQQVYVDGTTSQGYWLHGVSNAEDGYIEGGRATFTNQYAVCEEDWNQQASKSDGSAGMVRYMRYANVNPRKYDNPTDKNIVNDENFAAVVEGSVSVSVGGTAWTIVDNFDNSTADDKHVVVDYSTGALIFGDGEKGAIPAAGQQINVSYSVDRDGFVDVSEAMKETTRIINEANAAKGIDSEHEALVYSSYETNGFISKMNDRGYNGLYDGLTIHPYSGTPSGSGTAFYDSAMSLAESVGVKKVQDYVKMMPADKVPVISEYGIFRSTDPLLRSQTHAIYIAKVLMEYVRLNSPYIQKHCLTDWYSSGADSLGPTQQAVIQVVAQNGANTKTGEGDFAFFSTPSAHVFQMLNSSFGTEVLGIDFDHQETMSNGVKSYSALASKDKYDNYYVAFVNVDRENAKNLEVIVDGKDFTGKDVEVQMLSSDDISDANTLENPDNVVVETTAFVAAESSITVEVPKHSFVVVKVSAGVDKTALEEAIEDANDFVEGDYTAESWAEANVAAVIADAEAVLNNQSATKEEVETAIAALEAAAAKLENIPVDKAALEAKIAEADALVQEDYTGAAWTELQKILTTAKAVAAKANATQEVVDKVLADLTAAMDALKKIIPVSKMNATVGNAHNDTLGANNVLDNDTSTIWHTDWNGTSREDHYLQLALTEEYVVDGLCYLPRQEGINGMITGYKILVSTDGENWDEAAIGTWPANSEWKVVDFEGQNVNYVRLVSTNSASDKGEGSNLVFASAAEVRLTGKKYVEPTPDPEPEVPTTPVTTIFDDVADTDWFADEVQYVYDKGIMTGVSDTTFEPETAVTRATIVQTLYKLEGKPAVSDFTKYNSLNDTLDSIWWKNGLAWALNEGVAKGDSKNNVFNPDNEVTREDLATFIYRYAQYKGVDVELEGTVDEILGDTFVNSWAKTAFAWAIETGLIKGKTINGVADLAPQVGATRAELATIMMRFYENNNLK